MTSAARVRAVLLCLVVLVGLGGAPASAVHDISTVGSQSVSEVAACTAESDQLLAAIVVDESLSLRATDPDDLRVGAIETALDSLKNLGTKSADTLDVQARLSVFGESSTELVGWGAVSDGHVEELREAARNELPSRDGASLTDYRRALADAQQALNERADEIGGTSCKLVLWLTDGKLDVDGRGDRPATDAARLELCEPGGIIDGVRADGVAVIAMGLMTFEGEGAVTPVDRDRLQAIAEGRAGDESCGTQPVPADVTNGAFLNADDAAGLAQVFAKMGALLEGFTSTGTIECPSGECVDGRLPVHADPGVGGFRLVTQSTVDAAPMQLVAPDGQTVVLDAPTTEVAGAAVSVLENGTLTTVDVREVAQNTGTWTLVTDPSVTAVIDLYHFWGVTLTVEAPEGVVIGEQSALRITPRGPDGSPVPLTAYESADVEVAVDGVDTPFRADGDGWAGEVTVPVDDAVSSLAVSARATAVTRPNGLALGPVTAQQTLDTRFPPSYPSLTPAQLDFRRLDGVTTAGAVLTLTGADRGPTRACFEPGIVAASPVRSGTVELAANVDCIEIEADETVDVAVELTAEDAADGRISGTLPVALHGVDDGDPIEAKVPFTATMVRPVDTGTQLGLVAALTAVALLLAYGTAVLARRVLGRFQLSSQTKYAAVPVRMTARGLERTDGRAELLSSDEFRHLPVQGKHRSFTAGPAAHAVTYPWNPLAEPQAVVTSEGRVPVTHVVKEHRDPWTRRTELPGSTGFVVVTERPTAHAGEPELRGTLVMVIDPGSQSVASLLPHRLAELGRVPWEREVTRTLAAWEQLASASSTSSRSTPARPQAAAGKPVRPSRTSAATTDGQQPPPPRRIRPSDPVSGHHDAGPPPRRRSSAEPAPSPRLTPPSEAPPPPSGRGAPPPPPPRR